jgi:hypothetical protein
MRTLILSVVLLSLIPFSLYASTRSNSGGLAERVAELEAQVDVLAAALQEAQEILQFVHVETEEVKGLAGPHWIIEGANVHVRSGRGNTFDDCGFREPNFPNCESLTGLGNLIVGYNEIRRHRSGVPDRRTGSHNLVVGVFHAYTSFGGFVAGEENAVTGAAVSVSGGTDNEARGQYSSVSGGHGHVASGAASSVSGGDTREAPDDFNWAAGNLFEAN